MRDHKENDYYLDTSGLVRRWSIDYYIQSTSYSEYWNTERTFDSYKIPDNVYAPSRSRFMSFSEIKRKKVNLLDFVVKYKTEVFLLLNV